MIVIKLGGSLAEAGTLACCLDTVERRFRGRPVAVVPGGGPFADQVRRAQRQWRFDDESAHTMALLAMQQMALLFHALKPQWPIARGVAGLQQATAIRIWSPDPDELDRAGVPASWDITSDSLAAWLAGRISASELVLVKSADIAAGASLSALVGQGVVDRAFSNYAAEASFNTTIINQLKFNG